MSMAMHQVSEPKTIAATNDPRMIATTVKAVVRVTEAWSLTNRQASELFDVPIATWNRMKAGNFRGTLDQDKLTRASLLIGIFKGLRLLFNGPLQCGWPTRPNDGAAFGGQTPVNRMIHGGIPAMIAVRRHVDALRGGL